MADKQFALGGTRSAGYVEDEDPLAELARIVGFQEQPAVKQRNEAPVASQRREQVLAEFPASTGVQPQASAISNPVADLEDELLRAFEIYDAPRTETVPPPAVNANEPRQRVEPVVVPPQPSSAIAASRPNEDEDPFAALAAVVAAQPVVARAPSAPVQQRREPAFESAPAPVVAPAEAALPVQEEPVFSVDLLEQELLESLGEAEIAAPAPPPVAAPEVKAAAASRQQPTSFRSDGSFHLPMATFHKPAPKPEPQAVQPAPEPFAPAPFTVAEAPLTRDEPELAWELPGVDADDLVVNEPPVAAAPVKAAPQAPSMDGLLDDVSRYEVPSQRPAAASQPRDPAFMASLAAITGVATQIGQPQEKAPEPAMRREPEAAWQPAQDDFSAKGDEPDLGDLFGPGDFELDLDAFEQQLTDLSFEEEARPAPVRHQAAEPVRAPAEDLVLEPFAEFVGETEAHASSEPEVVAEVPFSASYGYAAQAPVAERPTAPQHAASREPAPLDFSDLDFSIPERRPAAEPARREPVAAVPPVIPVPDYSIDESAPFDPSMLAESEDAVEAVGEIDVPEIQPQVDEQPAVVVPEYDLDIDAEMANLFGSLPPITPAAQGVKSVSASIMADSAIPAANFGMAPKSSSAPDGFDEFERALEDDFRSMLTQPLGQPQAIHGSPLQPPEAFKPQSSGRTLRSVLLAACATGILAVAGVGGYWFLSGDSREIASSEPRVIAADKGPVKVVPENPGGVTVPNQDKAVYDRVAGKEADVVKQGQLVTTNEEPVDVVQKTLVPENTLANESETEAPAPVSTPVEDTKDARLLPSDAAAQPASTDDQSNAPGGVSVRKVKTMIVKPDGTLVPREEAGNDPSPAPVDAPATSAASAATTPAATVPAPAVPAPAAADIRTSDPAPAAQPAQSDDAAATAEVLATVANSNVETQPTVKVAKTSKASDAAPVPQARPSDQPVNVTDTVTENGNVRPAAAAQQTASAEPVAKPAAASGSYGLQIASLPSEADAKASIPKMSAKFGGVLGGRSIGIRKADIPGKGTYYRLRVDVGSKEDAVNLCLKLKSAGGSCLVSK